MLLLTYYLTKQDHFKLLWNVKLRIDFDFLFLIPQTIFKTFSRVSFFHTTDASRVHYFTTESSSPSKAWYKRIFWLGFHSCNSNKKLFFWTDPSTSPSVPILLQSWNISRLLKYNPFEKKILDLFSLIIAQSQFSLC